MTAPAVDLAIDGHMATATFRSFDLGSYDTFIRVKKLPEVRCSFDWELDAYRLRFPARFAPRVFENIDLPVMEKPAVSDYLFDYQKWVNGLALDARCFAWWGDCGLGKTPVGLEEARQIEGEDGAIIWTYNNIVDTWTKQADQFYGTSLPLEVLRTRRDVENWLTKPKGVAITNYEKLDDGPLEGLCHVGLVVADESSMLKSGGGVRKWNLIKSARGVEYKLSLTATPAPNDAMEYASQASFLEKLRTEDDILWTYFSRNQDTNDWEVKPHAREAFYRFMATWSLYMRSPASYGFKDNVKSVPEPEYIPYPVPATKEQLDFAMSVFSQYGAGLMGDRRLGVTPRILLSQAARGFLYNADRSYQRVASLKPDWVAETVRAEVASGRQVIVWVEFDAEGEIIAERLKGLGPSVEILSGKTPQANREPMITAFERGGFQVLIAKASMIGFGLNMQYVGAMVVSGVTDSFEQFYQMIRRAVRYGQMLQVRVHIPFVPELEGIRWDNCQRKAASFEHDAAEQERWYKLALQEAA